MLDHWFIKSTQKFFKTCIKGSSSFINVMLFACRALNMINYISFLCDFPFVSCFIRFARSNKTYVFLKHFINFCYNDDDRVSSFFDPSSFKLLSPINLRGWFAINSCCKDWCITICSNFEKKVEYFFSILSYIY